MPSSARWIWHLLFNGNCSSLHLCNVSCATGWHATLMQNISTPMFTTWHNAISVAIISQQQNPFFFFYFICFFTYFQNVLSSSRTFSAYFSGWLWWWGQKKRFPPMTLFVHQCSTAIPASPEASCGFPSHTGSVHHVLSCPALLPATTTSARHFIQQQLQTGSA